MIRREVFVVALFLTAVAPTTGADEPDPARVLGTGHITQVTHPGIGTTVPGVLTEDWHPSTYAWTTPADGDSPQGFWVPVTDGTLLSTHTHPDETAAGQTPAYDISVNLYGSIIEEDGWGWWYERHGFIQSCGLHSVGDVTSCFAHRSYEVNGDGGTSYTVTHAYVTAHAGATPAAGLEVALLSGAGTPGQIEQNLGDLGLAPSQPGPRTQTGLMTPAHLGVGLGTSIIGGLGMTSFTNCPYQLTNIQPGTGFHLTSNFGGAFNIVFYSDAHLVTHRLEYHGPGDDWGNVPWMDYACIELENWLGDPLSEFSYTDGLPRYAAQDHSDRRFVTSWG